MLAAAHYLRDLLIPFLITGGALLASLLGALVVQRLLRQWAARVELRRARRYAPFVQAVLHAPPAPEARRTLLEAPTRRRPTIARLLLRSLHLLKGEVATEAESLAHDLGLIAHWTTELHDRRWWRRADAARALGLVRARGPILALVDSLDDEHAEVRASAVDALGRIGDPLAMPALLSRLHEGSNIDRVRAVEALRALGPRVSTLLVDYAGRHPEARAMAADLLGTMGTAETQDVLLEWTGDPAADVRAGAWRALAALGTSDRAFYHALPALDDHDPAVRATAALVLGRAGRAVAAPQLADHLDDEWEVAAQSARALARLGADGLAALTARAAGPEGHGQALAAQLVWEAARR